VWNGHNFAITEADQPFAQPLLRFIVRQPRRSLPRRRQTRRKFIQPINPRDFFDQIDFAFYFRAPRWLRAFPGRQNRAQLSAILVHAQRRKTQRQQNGLNLAVRNVRTHHAQSFRARNRDFLRRALSRINIHYPGQQFAAR